MNRFTTNEIENEEYQIHETFEFKPKIRKVKIPDKSGRGRGMLGMPKPSGPPRPVFKPLTASPAGSGPGPSSGRGRGASQSRRPAREESKKPSRPMNASPFGAPTASSEIKNLPEQLPAPTTEFIVEQNTSKQKEDNKRYEDAPEAPKQVKHVQIIEKQEQPVVETPKPKEQVPTKKSEPAATGEEGGSGFFGMMSGLLSLLNLRKQAYTGKPSSAMYYCKDKKRWIIAGEEESDDDAPPPPPKAVKKAGEDTQKKDEVKRDTADDQTSGASSLTSVGFSGALANRGRGRGRGRGKPTVMTNRFPQTFDSQSIKASEVPNIPEDLNKSKGELNQTALYQTALDISQLDKSQNLQDQNQKSSNENNQTQILNITQDMRDEIVNDTKYELSEKPTDLAREQKWEESFKKQQEKINAQKHKIQKQQKELVRQREEAEQTIEDFTQLCRGLEFRGREEVEELQTQIELLKEQMTCSNKERAIIEYRNTQAENQIQDLEIENQEFQQQVSKLKMQIQDNQLQLENQYRVSENEPSSLTQDNQNQGLQIGGEDQENQGLGNNSQVPQNWLRNRGNQSIMQSEQKQLELLKLLDAQCQNEKLQWQLSILQVDQSHLISEMHKVLKENEQMVDLKQKLKAKDNEIENQKILIRQLKEDTQSKAQEELKLEQTEKQQLRGLIQKLQQEKERITDVNRERKRESDEKLAAISLENQQLEQQIKKMKVDKHSQNSQIERNKVVQQDMEQNIADYRISLQKKDGQIEEIKGVQRETQERLNNLKRSEKERIDKDMNGWYDQVKQLEEILQIKENEQKMKDQEFENLRKAKLEIEEKLQSSQANNEKLVPSVRGSQNEGTDSQLLINQLEQQDIIKQRLNEHIAYLQAEIRKRDEFMETSDFDDDSDISNTTEDDANQTTNQDLLDDNELDAEDEFVQKYQQRLQSSQSLKSNGTNEARDTTKAQTPRVKQIQDSPSDINIRKIDDQIRQQLQKANSKRQKKKTMQQLLKEQIEDSRSHLKKEIEERMLIERDNRMKGESVHKLKEGLGDIMRVIKDIISVNIECQQSQQTKLNQIKQQDEDDVQSQEQSDDNIWENEVEEDELVQSLISKIFEIQRNYQQQISELSHNLQMEKLKIEDMESLTLDLEILNQEKEMTDQELSQITEQVVILQRQLSEKEQQLGHFSHQEEIMKSQNKANMDEFNLKIIKLKNENKENIAKIQASIQDKLQQLIDNYNNEIIPELQSNHQRISQKQDQEIQNVTMKNEELLQQLKVAQKEYTDLNKKITEREEQVDNIYYQNQQDLKEATDKMKLMEIEKQQLINSLDDQKLENDKDVQALKTLRNELNHRKKEYEENQNRIRLEFDASSLEIIAQRDKHKQYASDLKLQVSKMEEELQNSQQKLESQQSDYELIIDKQKQEIDNLKSENSQREDEIFWSLNNLVTGLKSQLNDKDKELKAIIKEFEEKESFLSKNNMDINQMRSMYTEQINELENSQESQEKQISELLKIQEESKTEISMLKSEIESLQQARNEFIENIQENGQNSKDQLSEFQNLLDYQVNINDALNEQVEELQNKMKILNQEELIRKDLQTNQEQAIQLKANENRKLKEEMVQQQITESQLQNEISQKISEIEKLQILLKEQNDEKVLTMNSNVQDNNILQLNQQIELLENQLKQQQLINDKTLEISNKRHLKCSELEQINGTSKQQIDVLRSQVFAEEQAKIILQNELESLRDQMLQLQYQSELSKAESGFEEDQSQDQKQKELEEERLKFEKMTKRVKELEDREPLFKKSAEEMANQFKERIKKYKEEIKVFKDEIKKLKEKLNATSSQPADTDSDKNGELIKLREERDKLQLQLQSMNQEQLSIIEHIETSKEFSILFDRHNSTLGLARDESVISNIRKIEMNLSMFDSKIDSMTQEKKAVILKILECLKNAGMEGLDNFDDLQSFDVILEKLQQLFQNYSEDRRQIETLLINNQQFQKENEDFKNANYDLRYELQEINIKYEDLEELLQKQKQSVEVKKETTQKAQKPVQQVQDDSFVQPKIKADQPVSERAIDNNYADLSINKSVNESEKAKSNRSTEESEKGKKVGATKPTPAAVKRAGPPQIEKPAGGGGLFGTIASFFLTETEMENSSIQAKQGRGAANTDDASEYEYYEEYDDEAETDNPEKTNEDAYQMMQKGLSNL